MWMGGEDAGARDVHAQHEPDVDVGAFAAIDEPGYLNVILKFNPHDSLRLYIPRVVEYCGGEVVDKDKLESFISLCMEGKTPSSLKELQALLFSEGVANGMVALRTGVTLPSIPVAKLSDRRRHVQILGLFNSGTNLLEKILNLNFGNQVLLHSDFKPMAKFWLMAQEDVCYADEYPNRQTCSLWKHADLELVRRRAPKRFQQFEADDVVAIAIVRDPLAWLQGVRKAPYELGNNISQDDWLTRSYTLRKDWYGGPPREGYPSLSEAWNSHTHSYDSLSQYGFRRNIAIRYEDVVMNLEKAIQTIADVLELPTPTFVSQLEDSAKFGDSHGHEEAKRLIEGNVYQKMFSQSEKKKACARLDMDIMHQHGYHSCDEQPANAELAGPETSTATAPHPTRSGKGLGPGGKYKEM